MSPHRHSVVLVPLALCAALLVGCGGDDEGSEPLPSVAASTSSSSEPAETTAPPTTDSAAPVPPDARELCEAFDDAAQALLDNAEDLSPDLSQDIPDDLLDALAEWGEDLRDAELPASFDAEQRDGVRLMSRVLLQVPDDATGRDLADLQAQLSDTDSDKVGAVTGYVEQTCGITGF